MRLVDCFGDVRRSRVPVIPGQGAGPFRHALRNGRRPPIPCNWKPQNAWNCGSSTIFEFSKCKQQMLPLFFAINRIGSIGSVVVLHLQLKPHSTDDAYDENSYWKQDSSERAFGRRRSLMQNDEQNTLACSISKTTGSFCLPKCPMRPCGPRRISGTPSSPASSPAQTQGAF